MQMVRTLQSNVGQVAPQRLESSGCSFHADKRPTVLGVDHQCRAVYRLIGENASVHNVLFEACETWAFYMDEIELK